MILCHDDILEHILPRYALPMTDRYLNFITEYLIDYYYYYIYIVLDYDKYFVLASVPSSHGSLSTSTSTPTDLLLATNKIVEWARLVNRGLTSIQWQLIGYQVTASAYAYYFTYNLI